MSNIIDKIQLSGITYDIGGGSITIDPTLDSGSTNPVANSAITTALDAKVNVADNAVSTKPIMYAYDKGDTAWKNPYNQGLRINQFFVKYTQSWEKSNVPAWNNPMYITNDGSTTSQINLRVNASNYQITSVASTSGDFAYALEGGQVNVRLPSGYYISSFAQKYSFQILYPKYVITGGQSAQALRNTYNVIQNIYNEVPKRWITGGSISCSSTNINAYLYDNNGNSNDSSIQLGTSIKGDGNRLDVYFDGQTIHQKILNTGSGDYCDVPNNVNFDYVSNLDEVTLFFNSAYTGSNTSYTIQVQTINPNTYTYSDYLYYDVANHTLDASSANYVTATTVGDDYTYSIRPKQEYFNYRIVRIRENNYCNICGIDNQWKEGYIITGVTTPSYSYQAQEIIDDLYSKVGGGKVIEAGRGIAVTTGETADTVSFNLPISAGTGSDSIIEGYSTVASGSSSHAEGMETTASGDFSHAEGISTTASGDFSHAEGASTTASGDFSHAEGSYTKANGSYSHAEGDGTRANGNQSHAEGFNTLASGQASHAEGYNTKANNQSEHASGQFNVSNSASTTFGDSGNTLFSVGNGTGDNARHNAFEIRQNGDIYLTKDGQDVKLQDQLGGSSINVVQTTGTSTTDVMSQNAATRNFIYNINLNYKLNGRDTLALQGKGKNLFIPYMTINGEKVLSTNDLSVIETSAITTSISSSSTDAQVPSAKAVYDAIQEGGGGTVDQTIISGSTNAVAGGAVYNKIDEIEEVTAAGLNALNDKITPTVELTQAQYDALVDKDPNTYYVITDAQAVDLTNYYTKSETNTLLGGKADTATTYTKTETDNAITAATSTKQDTLVSGTNIKTINNESLLGSGNLDIQGGKAVSGGTNISITTGETSDTINCTLSGGTLINIANNKINCQAPIRYGTGSDSVIVGTSISTNKATGMKSIANGGDANTASGQYSYAEGFSTTAATHSSHSEGWFTKANGQHSHSEGNHTVTNKDDSHAEGKYTVTNNVSEHASGQYNVSSSASTTWGDSGNTLFSVGNGASTSARHNAFEIRQNGDIYLTSGGTDIKLQDHLGGGGSSINVVQTTGTSTTDVMSQDAVTTVINTVSGAIPSTYVSAISADSDAGYQRFYRFSTPSNFNYFLLNNAKINNKAILSTSWGGFETNFSLVETSAITTSVTSSSTDAQVPSAKAVNDALGGLKLVKLSQAEYNALTIKDAGTLYIILG